jgi:hypothetical protein
MHIDIKFILYFIKTMLSTIYFITKAKYCFRLLNIFTLAFVIGKYATDFSNYNYKIIFVYIISIIQYVKYFFPIVKT